MTKEEKEFLIENNAIEGVTDKISLQQAAFSWEYLKGLDSLNITEVRKTHKILMLRQNLYPNEKGYFREVPVWVGGHECMDWRKIQSSIREWSIKMNHQNANAERLHVEYEKIHPFVDGNGRTGRMFMNWRLLKSGQPIRIIHAGEEQFAYYKWFKE